MSPPRSGVPRLAGGEVTPQKLNENYRSRPITRTLYFAEFLSFPRLAGDPRTARRTSFAGGSPTMLECPHLVGSTLTRWSLHFCGVTPTKWGNTPTKLGHPVKTPLSIAEGPRSAGGNLLNPSATPNTF